MTGTRIERAAPAKGRRTTLTFLVMALVAMSYFGWRSVFIGGEHEGLTDPTVSCYDSPWHTLLHPLPPSRSPVEFPRECNADARGIVFGWGAATAAMFGVVIWHAVRCRRPTE